MTRGKKLTEKEKEEREIKKIVKKIMNLEKRHDERLIETACYRYKNAKLEERKAREELKKAEERVSTARNNLKKIK